MEQLKPYLIQLRKHHFWVLSVVVLLTALIGWYLASSELSRVYAAGKAKIEGSFSKMSAINNTPNHPNESFKTDVDSKTSVLKVDVLKAWHVVFDEQKNKVLLWPETLGREFLDVVPALKPQDEIPVDLCEIYQNYIQNEFPNLLKIVDAKSYKEVDKDEADQNAGVPPAADGAPAEEGKEIHDFKVRWDVGDQTAIAAGLEFPNRPTSKQVRLAQENLWVYGALLNIIKNVNKNATGSHNVIIKQINELGIAEKAAKKFTGGQSRLERSSAPVHTNPVPPAVGVDGGQAAQGPTDGRYVDAAGRPLGPESQVPPEFKRMPIHVRVVMDQREIHQLLAECANSPLPVEVRQLRMSGRGVTYSDDDGGGSRRGRGPVVGGMAGVNDDKPGSPDDMNPYDVPVEIHGIIYIFNPPDEAKLGVIAAAPAPGEAPPGAAPAAARPGAPPSGG